MIINTLNSNSSVIVYEILCYKIYFTIINQLPEILEEYSDGEHYDGIYFALTDESEHPAFAFLENAKLAQPNQHHWLRLETSVVRTLILFCAKLVLLCKALITLSKCNFEKICAFDANHYRSQGIVKHLLAPLNRNSIR